MALYFLFYFIFLFSGRVVFVRLHLSNREHRLFENVAFFEFVFTIGVKCWANTIALLFYFGFSPFRFYLSSTTLENDVLIVAEKSPDRCIYTHHLMMVPFFLCSNLHNKHLWPQSFIWTKKKEMKNEFKQKKNTNTHSHKNNRARAQNECTRET